MADKAVDTERIRTVQGIVAEFEKTIKISQMYEDNHPSTMKAVERCYEKFSQFLSQNANLVLRVGQFELFYEDNLVHQNLERNTSLAFKLFRDGLRGVGFERGFSVDELLEVMRLFTVDFSESEEDDIVTKLWEKNLPHVQYWEAEEELQPPENVEQRQFEVTPVTPGPETERPPDAEVALEELQLQPEEIHQLKQEVLLIEKEGMSVDLVDIVEHVLRSSEDPAIKSRLIDGSPGLVFNLLTRSSFAALNRYLYVLKNLADYVGLVDLKTEKLVLNIFSRLETEFVILNLAPELEKGNKEIECFLAHLSKEIVEPLFRLLESLTKNPGRQIVIRVLARLTADDKSPVMRRLEAPEQGKVQAAILILEEIGDRQGVELLKGILKRTEPELRRFLLETVVSVRSAGVGDILTQAIRDSEFDIRLLALRQMAQTRDESFVDPIMKSIADKRFVQKEVEERRAFFYAVADCGQQKVVDFFRRTMKKWTLFPSKRIWELRQIAVFSLARINDEGARKALEDGLKSRNRRMRELCTKALVLTRRKDDQF